MALLKNPKYNQLSMSSRIQVTWVVKFHNGQVKGPYSTEAVLRLITEGSFSGNELISKLPGGHWTQISKEPEFYDRLIEVLEGVVETDPAQIKRMEAETVIMSAPAKPVLQPVTPPPLEEITTPKIEVVDEKPLASPLALPKWEQNKAVDSIIELTKMDAGERVEVIKRLKVPLSIFGSILVLTIGYLLFGGDSYGEKINLIAPAHGGAALSDSQIKEKLNAAILAIQLDTFESYVDAENKLVSIVEGAQSNLEVRGLLCVVYKELWPYAKQDAADMKVIATVTQSTRALNVISPFGGVCEITKLLTGGRYKEARGVVESLLEEENRFSLLPVLYAEKAELLEGEKDFTNAIPYYEKSSQLWDKWLKPKVQLGSLLGEGDKANEGAAYLKKVLQLNPHHKGAKIHLGLIEYRRFKKVDDAYATLTSAISSSGRVQRPLASEAYQVLAEISVQKGEKREALNYAQKGFELNPNNGEVHQLVLRLGGSDKIKADKNQNNELIFMGDQYVRQGDCLAAQAEFKAAFEVDRKNGTAALKAAKCLWQLNQSFEAIDWLNKAMKAEPKLISAYVLQADYMTQRYDFTGALQVLTNAIRMAPNNYEVLRGLALLELRKNSMRAAINYGMRSLKAYDGDVETYILLSKASAGYSQSINPLNKSEIDKKEAAQKDGIRFATKAVELDATNSDAQINYAKVLAQANGVDFGISYMKELVKKFSYSYEYRIALAEIYKTEDRFTQAKELYEQVIDADPRNKKALLGLGECYRAMGLIDKSLKAYLSAAVIDPTDGEALFQAGKVYFETGRYEESIQQFKRVQNLNPFYPRTYYYIGKAAFASGNYPLALEAAKAEKNQNPNLADSYILSAEVHSAMKQYGDCATEYSQAMKLRPQGADIYVRAGQCYRQSGAIDVAEDMLALAAARESGNADIYKEQGAIYEIKGDAVSAVQAYNKYLGLSPNAPDRTDIESKINRLRR